MTSQISDCFRYRDKDYTLAGISEGELFDPTIYNLRPVVSSTACWRGYHVVYSILMSHLIVSKLYINLSEDQKDHHRQRGPTINGVFPKLPTKKERFSFNSTYADLNFHMKYTGGLLIADGFFRELYVHMGFHPAWKFETVFELIFENGILVQEHDRSKAIAELRKKMLNAPQNADADSMPTAKEIQRFIEQSFNRKYSQEF